MELHFSKYLHVLSVFCYNKSSIEPYFDIHLKGQIHLSNLSTSLFIFASERNWNIFLGFTNFFFTVYRKSVFFWSCMFFKTLKSLHS